MSVLYRLHQDKSVGTQRSGNRTKQFLQNAKVEELPENKVEKKVDEPAGD